MSAPSSFKLEVMDPQMLPPPAPPRYLKPQIYNDPSVFKHIDDYAVNEARTNYRNFRDLIWYLCYKKNYNQLEKFRAIFRWMTTKNMYTIMFDSELPGSPEQIIAGFKDGKTTYARIFECLCNFSGIHSVTLSGWAKGVDYRPGAPITSTPINHSWNACFIDGNWQLVDSHWATRYLQSERNTPENLVYEYDDFYFMPEPSHLIYSHCPEDPSWQLVHPAVSRAQFEEFPLVKSFFFSVGMRFLQQNQGIVYTRNGILTLTLAFNRPAAFTFKLAYGDKMSESVHGIALKRYVIQETTQNRVTFFFRAPREGNYYLTLFAQLVSKNIRIENVFKAACEYKIVCDQAAGDIRPYPQCSDANWGPGAPVTQYGLTPSHKTAILAAPGGRAEVSFAKSRDVRLFAKLNRDGIDEDQLERCVNVREQDNMIYITVQLPARGEYGLEIYANEPAKEGDTFTHMCQYLASYIERDFGAVYGQVFDRNDLAFGGQATPMVYNAPSDQYAQQPGDMSRMGPGGTMSPGGAPPGTMAPGGGPPGGKQVYSTSSQGWDGDTFTQRTFKEESESTDDGMRSYRQQTTQQDVTRPPPWEVQQMTTRMESVNVGGKKAPPPTAPKPGGGRPGYEDDLPPPPPELMDQKYAQQQQRAPDGGEFPPPPEGLAGATPYGSDRRQPGKDEPKPPPIEVVYVSTGARSPRPDQKSPSIHSLDQEESKQKPIEVVYVGGGKLSPSMARRPGSSSEGESPQSPVSPGSPKEPPLPPPPRTSGAPVTSTTTLTTTTTTEERASPAGSPSTPRKSEPASKHSAARMAVLMGSRAPKGDVTPEELEEQERLEREAALQAVEAENYEAGGPDYQGRPGQGKDQFPPPPPPPGGEKVVYFIPRQVQGGRPIQYDQYGKPIMFDRYGCPVDSTGRPLQRDNQGRPVDGYGKPIQYDAEGRPVQYDMQGRPYDQYGKPIKYDAQGRPVDQDGNPQIYDNQGRPVDEYGRPIAGTAVPVYHESYPFGGGQQTTPIFAQHATEPETEYKPHPQKTYTSSITIAPPAAWKPTPISEQQEAPKPAPPAVPPKPFKDTSIFQNVDEHAVEVSKLEHKSFRDLVWHLIYARDITNELEKARAIFLWLCSKDLSQLNFGDVDKNSPEEILISLQKGRTTYAVVYETLCSYAGLHCKTISGYAKGAEYKPGMKFTGEQGQHSWNAVLVNGAWRLVDCHWAARRLVGKKVTRENVRYELDEYYFMPDPHQLIFTHFPDDTNWQLVERLILLSDFENLVPVKSAFFKYGLQILTHREAVIRTNREITIRIGCPPMKSDALAFTFTLAYDDGREEFQGTKLNRFGMQEMVDNVSFFTIRPPEKGSYRLIIYAKDLSQVTKEGVYGGVCEYELICEGTPVRAQPFPPCVHTSWGPGDSASKYSLVALQKGAIFSTVNGLAEVRFRLPKELRFTAKLKSNEKDDKALAGFIMHRVVGDVAIFTITSPCKGEFGLEIYANDPETDGNSLFHAYQYLIICMELKGPVEPLPTLPPGYLGPQPSFKKLGLAASSHDDPYVQTDSGDLQVSFHMSQPLRMTSQLIFVSENQNEDCSDYVLQQGRGESVMFLVKLPKTGLYKFQIYALPYSDTSESLPGVYNYLLNCRNTYATLNPFPKQYGQWKEGCCLHEPLEGTLQANRPSKGSASSFQYIYFKIDVPKANSVAIVVGDDWTQLDQKQTGSWEGEVFMEKHWGRETKAAVCANYGSVKASYSTLLEYSL